MNTLASLRPGSGATRRVWDLADQITRDKGRLAKRKEVIDRFVSEGGNPNTASTQYQHWKSERDVDAGEVAGDLDPVRLSVAPDGRLVIPADLRRAMRLDADGAVLAQVVNGELRVTSARTAIERLQDLLLPLKAGTESVVDEFLAERRALWREEE